MGVVAPTRIIRLLLRLPPGIVTAISFRGGCPHVAAGPLGAGRQSEVDEVRVVVVGAGETGLGGLCIVEDDVDQRSHIGHVDLPIFVYVGYSDDETFTSIAQDMIHEEGHIGDVHLPVVVDIA